MRLLAQLAGHEGGAVVELVPRTPAFAAPFGVTAAGMIVQIDLPALTAATVEAVLELYRYRTSMWDDGIARLSPSECRRAGLADFLNAENGEAHLAAIPAQFGAEEVAEFAGDAGAILRANLKVDLAYRQPTLAAAPSALRFLRLVGVEPAVVAELAGLLPIDQMLALEHALDHVMTLGAPSRTAELELLAASVPDGTGFTFESRLWREWWWRLGFATRHRDFLRAVAYAVGAAQARCPPGSTAALDTALARMAATASCRWFTASPAYHAGPSWPGDETRDGHFQALVALGLAAERLADGMGLDAAQRDLARLVIERLRFTPNNTA